MSLIIDGNSLTIEDVVNVARNSKIQVILSEDAKIKITNCCQIIIDAIENNEVHYGCSTGFGSLANKVINKEDASRLSRNIIISHAVGVDEPLNSEIVRAGMLIRVNSLSKGHSGVKLETVQRLLDILNNNIIPHIPSKGSLACSGDLCLLAHLGLVFTEPNDENDIADIKVTYNNEVMWSKDAMKLCNLNRVKLGPKEGLSITNGSSFTAGIACLAYVDAQKIAISALGGLSLSLEALIACPSAFDARIHNARNHKGQIEAASSIRQLIKKSEFIGSSSKIQDCYSLRCSPQVHGVLFECLEDACKKITNEINAATDNPLIFGSNNAILSGGNFHGEILGYVLDTMKIAIAEIGSISERRNFRILDSNLNNNLSDMLTHSPGLNSGYMITQYTSCALVLDNQKQASSDTIYSLPTCCSVEDHNSNAYNAALNALKVIKNVKYIIVNEYLCSIRGIQLRYQDEKYINKKLGQWTSNAYLNLLKLLHPGNEDHLISDEMTKFLNVVFTDEFVKSIEDIRNIDDNQRIIGIPPGTKDYGPKEMLIRERAINIIKTVFKKHALNEIDTPTFERKDILLGKYGDQQKLVFDLADQGGDSYSLRYDLTVPTARMCAMSNISNFRRYQISKVFRRDRPSIEKARMREFMQCDADLIGTYQTMKPDAEILKIVTEVLDQFNFEYVTKINHKKLLDLILDDCNVPKELQMITCSSIDKLDKNTWDEVQIELIGKGLSSETINMIESSIQLRGAPYKVLEILRKKYKKPEFIEIFDEMELLFNYLTIFDCLDKHIWDLSLARGLSYYTHLILESVIIGGEVGSICGGGRYDKLIGQFSNRDIPAVGFSIGIERIICHMEKQMKDINIENTQIYIFNLNKEHENIVMKITNQLWKNNYHVQFSQQNLTIKEHLGFAKNIPFVIILGEDEIKNGGCAVKNMNTKKQVFVLYENIVSFFKEQFNN
jgi:histidine ammonia-lyase